MSLIERCPHFRGKMYTILMSGTAQAVFIRWVSLFQGVLISGCPYFRVSLFQGVLISGCPYFRSVLISGCPYFRVSLFQECPYFRGVLIPGVSLFQGILISGCPYFRGVRVESFTDFNISYHLCCLPINRVPYKPHIFLRSCGCDFIDKSGTKPFFGHKTQ